MIAPTATETNQYTANNGQNSIPPPLQFVRQGWAKFRPGAAALPRLNQACSAFRECHRSCRIPPSCRGMSSCKYPVESCQGQACANAQSSYLRVTAPFFSYIEESFYCCVVCPSQGWVLMWLCVLPSEMYQMCHQCVLDRRIRWILAVIFSIDKGVFLRWLSTFSFFSSVFYFLFLFLFLKILFLWWCSFIEVDGNQGNCVVSCIPIPSSEEIWNRSWLNELWWFVYSHHFGRIAVNLFFKIYVIEF